MNNIVGHRIGAIIIGVVFSALYRTISRTRSRAFTFVAAWWWAAAVTAFHSADGLTRRRSWWAFLLEFILVKDNIILIYRTSTLFSRFSSLFSFFERRRELSFSPDRLCERFVFFVSLPERLTLRFREDFFFFVAFSSLWLDATDSTSLPESCRCRRDEVFLLRWRFRHEESSERRSVEGERLGEWRAGEILLVINL